MSGRQSNDANHEVEELKKLTKGAEERIAKSLEELRQLDRNYASQIAQTKYELSKEIIEQANAPIARAVSVLTVIMVVVLAGGSALTFFVSSNLQSSFETLMKQRVESWLSLDDENSVASSTRDSYRTRALLDSYMIQLVRRKARGESMVNLHFKKGDEKRLLSIVESPDSDAADFYDALRLLSASRGEWGFSSRDDDVSRRLRKLFGEPEFDSARKLDILEIMSRDRGLLPVAIAFVENKQQPEEIRYQSFKMLKGYSRKSKAGDLAFEYALDTLKSSQASDRIRDAVEYIAGTEPFNEELIAFLAVTETQPRELRIDYRLAATRGWISLLPSPTMQPFIELEAEQPLDREGIRAMIAEHFSSLINDGLMLEVTDNFSGKPSLNLQYSQTSGTVTHLEFPLERLFEDSLLLKQMYELQNGKGLARFAHFFATAYKGETITSLRMEIPSDKLKVVTGEPRDSATVGRLSVMPNDDVFFVWKDTEGVWQDGLPVASVAPSTFKVIVDRAYLSYGTLSSEWIF